MRVFIDGLEVTDYVSMGLDSSERKDENFDTGSFVVAPIAREKPFDPGSIIFIDDEQYVLTGDGVSVCARGSTTGYRHEIRYAQLSRALEFVSIRGTDLRQPSINPHRRGYARRVYGPTSALSSFETTAMNYGSEALGDVYLSVRVFYSDKNYRYEHTSSTHKAIATLHEEDNWTGVIQISDGTSITTLTDIDFKKTVGEPGKSVKLSNLPSGGGSISVFSMDIGVSASHDFLFAVCYIEGKTYKYTYADVIRETIRAHWCKAQDAQSIAFVETDPIYSNPSQDFSFQQGTSLYDALKEIYDSLGMKLRCRYHEGYLQVYGSRYDEKGSSIEPVKIAENIEMSDANRNQLAEVSYQNAITENACYAPAYGTYTRAKSKKLGVPSQDSWHIITPQPIHAIAKVFARFQSATQKYTSYNFTEGNITYNLYIEAPASLTVDVTDYVYEREEQSLLDVSSWATVYRTPTQGNTVSWSKGQKDIYVGCIERTPIGTAHYSMDNLIKGATYRMFGDVFAITGKTPFDVSFNVKYVPQAKGAFEASCVDEKLYRGFEGKMSAKQSGSLNGISRLGDNVFGTVSRSGWGDKSTLIKVGDGSALPQIGDFISDEDGEWEVSALSKTKIQGGWQCAISLTKNFNRLAQRTKIDREIRQTEISPTLALESTNVYREYLYVSKPFQRGGTGVGKGGSLLVSLIGGLRSLDLEPALTGFVIKTYDKNDDLINSSFMPIISYQAGNALCFEGGFDGAVSAGYKTEAVSGWVTSYVSKPIKYADASGEARSMDAYAMGPQGEIADYSAVSSANALFSIENISCRKHANEILRFNYEVIALANDDMVVYPRLLRYALNEFTADCKVIKRSTPFSQFEGKLSGGEALSYASSSFDTDTNAATVVLNNTRSAGERWCIVDKDGYPLIACNEDGEGRPISFSMNIANMRDKHPNVICKVTLTNVASVTFSNGAVVKRSGYACLPFGSTAWSAVATEGHTLPSATGTVNAYSNEHYAELSITAS